MLMACEPTRIDESFCDYKDLRATFITTHLNLIKEWNGEANPGRLAGTPAGQLPANVVFARAFGGCFKISAKTELLSIATASASSAVSSVTKNCSALLSCER